LIYLILKMLFKSSILSLLVVQKLLAIFLRQAQWNYIHPREAEYKKMIDTVLKEKETGDDDEKTLEEKKNVRTKVFTKSCDYENDCSRFKSYTMAWELVEGFCFYYFNVFAWLYDDVISPLVHSDMARLMMLVFPLVAYENIKGTVMDAYATFVIEARHGFNKTTVRTFVKDALLIRCVVVLGTIVVGSAIFQHFCANAGDNLWFYAWIIAATMMFAIENVIVPLLMPLYYEFTPLEQNSLRDKIEVMTRKIGFPLDNIYVIDGSTRSNHANAFIYGCGPNKCIAIYDTELEQAYGEDQILGTVAHELGHWKNWDIIVDQLLTQMCVFMTMYAAGIIFQDVRILSDFGFSTPDPQRHPAIAIYFILELFCLFSELAFEWLWLWISRRAEYAADQHAVWHGYGEGLKRSLVNTSANSYSVNTEHPWYTAYFSTHPPLLERVEAIDAAMDKQK
jgi:STE24 endopeptidase